MNELQAAALVYADALVEYYNAQLSDVCDRERWRRVSRDALHTALFNLDQAALAEAKQGI